MSSLFHLMFGLTIMEDALDTACSENKGIILLGDFNKDLLPDSKRKGQHIYYKHFRNRTMLRENKSKYHEKRV